MTTSAKSNVVELRPEPAEPPPAPTVLTQVANRTVMVKDAGHLPLGHFVRVGNAVGCVVEHKKNVALIRTAYQQHQPGEWLAPTRAIEPGTLVTPLLNEDWKSLLQSLNPKRIRVGKIRQDGIDQCAYIPPLQNVRMLVMAASGGGKSTALISMITHWRNSFLQALTKPGNGRVQLPGCLCIDPKGDFGGTNYDEDGKLRPSLGRCLIEEPVLVGAGTFTCTLEDVPIAVLRRCLENLSKAQVRWCDTNLTDETGHAKIRAVLGNPHAWPQEFPEMTLNGEITHAGKETLGNLRTRFTALLKEPLFTDSSSTWQGILGKLYQGKCVVVDVSQFPEKQRSIVVVLIMKMLRTRQQEAKGLPYPIVFFADEFHRFKDAEAEARDFFREIRQFNIGVVLSSQQLTDFPETLVNNATHAVVLQVQHLNRARLVKSYDGLKPFEHTLTSLKPGQGFLIARDGVAIPVYFNEPAFLR